MRGFFVSIMKGSLIMDNLSVNRFLLTEPVGKLMRKYALPCVVSLLVAALYNIVDQIFIANASYLGSYGNAANTVVFPLTVVALAIAVMIGDGCCAYISISLGKKEYENACRSAGNAALLSIISGLALAAVYLCFSEPLLRVFGSEVNEETSRLSHEYFVYIAIGIPLYMFGQAMNPVIRADGSPKFAMISMLAGAGINIVLDPVFIFPLEMGMMGAALATVIGQAVTAILAAWYLFHTKALKFTKKSFAPKSSVLCAFLPLGLCSLLSQLSLVAAMAAINNMVYKYGAADAVFGRAELSQIPMAVIGIVMKFFQIVISVSVGLAAGCIPIVGYNIGAGRRDRARKLLTRLMICEFSVGAAALLAAELLPVQLIGIFGAGNESVYYTEFAIRSFRVYLCLLPLACVNKASFIFLQSLGKPWISTLLSMAREIVFGVGFALLLPVWFGLSGVLYSMPVSDGCTFIITVFVLASVYRELRA